MYSVTKSKIRDRIGTTEIERKSEAARGSLDFGTGWITVFVHLVGTQEQHKERLQSLASHPEQAGARPRRCQAGIRSRPAAVGRRWSRIPKMTGSLSSWMSGRAVSRLVGCWYVGSVEMAA